MLSTGLTSYSFPRHHYENGSLNITPIISACMSKESHFPFDNLGASSSRFVWSLLIHPSHRRRGTTAVLVRHKPQWHRHDHRGSAVTPPWSPWFRSGSVIYRRIVSRKIVKTADLLSPSHRRRGATAVLVRHKPQLHRHDRRGSAVTPPLIAVAPRKTFNIADLTIPSP